jgi:thiamine transport system permease protein
MIAIRQSRGPAVAALAFLGLALAAGFLPVLWMGAARGPGSFDSYILRVLSFTLLQAGLSALISIAIGLPVARALARRASFPGRSLTVRLLNLPLALPSIVVIIGIVEVYGAKGWLGGVFDIYGLQGILLAHVFFNFPLAARLMLSELERIPAEYWKLSAELGFRPADIWRQVEWPQLRGSLPGIALLIFLLCASSFAIVLTLGGGPQATTLEVAIYQALRADFDPQRASALALVQLALCTSLVFLAQRWGGLPAGWLALRQQVKRFDGQSAGARAFDVTLIGAGLLLLLPPLAALIIAGIFHFNPSGLLFQALATSIGLGSASAALAFLIVWPLANRAARSGRWRKLSGTAVLTSWIVPPAVLATGWFVTFIAYAGVGGLSAVLVIVMNAMMALPFAYQSVAPAVTQTADAHDRLCLNLGITGWNRFRQIDLPALKRPIALALVMALILSLGDLTAISLFGTQDFITLPALVYRQMGSYRFDEAIGTALLLGLLVFVLSSLAERWGAAR